MDRRTVLRGIASGVAAPLLGSLVPAELFSWGRDVHLAIAAGQAASGSWPPSLMQVLTLACDRIIPADGTPGAAGVGAPTFIAHMLSNWYDAPDRDRVITGLESLDTFARSRYEKVFSACSSTEQDALLLELDREGPSHWFGTVKYLTIWGYYTSEVGVVRELGQWPSPGRFDGCAPYAPRVRKAGA